MFRPRPSLSDDHPVNAAIIYSKKKPATPIPADVANVVLDRAAFKGVVARELVGHFSERWGQDSFVTEAEACSLADRMWQSLQPASGRKPIAKRKSTATKSTAGH